MLAAGLLGLTTTTRVTAADPDAAFAAYNSAFYVTGGDGHAYYAPDTSKGADTGFWTLAEEIEMAEDACDRNATADTQSKVNALCSGFLTNKGTTWNTYLGNTLLNDDIEWACIAMCRGYLATGNTAFRDAAKSNFDAVYARAWDTTNGGMYWTGSSGSKNACSNGPAAIVCCYLARIYNDPSYLTKAQNIYAWERNTLFNASTGAVADNINAQGTITNWYFTYNEGTFIGAADFLYKATGTRSYYQDALLAMNYTKNTICNSSGIFPAAAADGGDGDTFNGIGFRWIARFVRDQQLWFDYFAWLRANADAAWNVRRPDNLSWCKWATATPSGTLHSNTCAGSVVAMQVVPASDPTATFILVNKNSGMAAQLTTNNTAILQEAYSYTNAAQGWSVLATEDGSHFRLITPVTRTAISVSGNSTADGAAVVPSTYASTLSSPNRYQQWDFVDSGNKDGWFKIKNVGSGKMLDVSGGSTASDARIQQWTDNNTPAQLWRLQPQGDYYLRDLNSGQYVNAISPYTQQGTNVVQSVRQPLTSFQWRWHNVTNGAYWIGNVNALNSSLTMVVSVANASTSTTAKCVLNAYASGTSTSQSERLIPVAGGHFKFHFMHDDQGWDFFAGSLLNNTQLEQYTDTTNSWQSFDFERITGD